jgi:carboxymethylenebutenolidase
MTSLAVGFAAAAGPVAAQTVIKTDSQGLDAKEVKIPAAGGDMPAYVAMPAAGANFPTVLVVQEIFGVHEYIKDTCRRFAKAGYMAIAPELYARQGDPSKYTMQQIPDLQRDIVAKVPDSQVLGDLDACLAYAEKSGKMKAGALAVTGFCWGGRIVWLYAAHQPKLKAGVAWYGRLVGQATPLQPKHPIDVAKDLKAPVLGLYGGADQGIPNDTVEMMQAELKKLGKPSEIVLYPGMPHGFHADFRATYREQAAKDGWDKLMAWYKKHGAA